MTQKKFTFIDIFAGAGGLSEGFVDAGFIPVAHIEKNEDACNTLRTRACFYYLKSINKLDYYYRYLKDEITRDQLYEIVPSDYLDSVLCTIISEDTIHLVINHIHSQMETANVKNIDLVVGGPPCQAYSIIGRARKNMENDPRNFLYQYYCQILKEFKPKMFVFENVLGLFSAGQGSYLSDIKRSFKNIGYEIEFEVLTASDFDVLQNRKRIIIVGWKKGLPGHYPLFEKSESKSTVEEVLKDLPAISPGQESKQYKNDEITEYLHKTNIRSSEDVLTWHTARYHNSRDRQIYRLAIKKWDEKKARLRYSEVPEKLSTHENKHDFLDRYKVVAGDLPACQTITAHIAKDGHYYIHPDIKQARSISVREAARIQSFPDNFFFEGSRSSAFTQIGNAVPPLMAKGIAESIRSILNKL